MTRSQVWDDFVGSEYAKTTMAAAAPKTVVASAEKAVTAGTENKNPDPKSAPGALESINWQAGNGHVPDCTKFHDLKEVAKDILDVAKKAPTGRVAYTLVQLVRTAEAWESKGDPQLLPFVAELDAIIDTAIKEHTPA